jgi:GNAT superfamily N-acetyltransferase
VIRRSGPDEAELQYEIQRDASLAALAHIFPPDRYPYPHDDVRRRWQEFPGTVLVAERAGLPLGIAAVDDCFLHGLYVVPQEWGSGIAVELHDAAVAAAHGCTELRLWVLEHNARARRFYESHGWRPSGDTRVVSFPPNPLDLGYVLVRDAAA